MTAMLLLAFVGMVVSASLKNPQQPLVPEAAGADATPDTASLKQTASEPPMPPPYGSDDNKAPEPVPAADAPAAVGVEEHTTASLKQTSSEPPMPPPYGSDDNKLAEPAPADAEVVAEPAKAKEFHPEVYPVNQQAAMPLVPATPAFPPKGLNKKMAKVDVQAENFDLKNENTKLKMAVQASEKADKHATASSTEAPHADATTASSTPTRQEQIEAAIAQEEDAVHAATKAKADAAPTQDQHVDAPAQAEPAETAKTPAEEAPKTGMLSDPASTENKAAEPAVAAKGDLAAWSPEAKVVKLYAKLADAVGLNVNNMQSDAVMRAHAAAHSSSSSNAKAVQLVKTHSGAQQGQSAEAYLTNCTESGVSSQCCEATLKSVFLTFAMAMSYGFNDGSSCPDMDVECSMLTDALKGVASCPAGHTITDDDGEAHPVSAEIIGEAWDDIPSGSVVPSQCKTMSEECEVSSWEKYGKEANPAASPGSFIAVLMPTLFALSAMWW